MASDLVKSSTSLDQLNKSLTKGSLADLVKARTRRSLLLVDCSGSMSDRIRSGERKIDALRATVKTLRETHPVPVVAFGLSRYSSERPVALIDTVPEPAGQTPLHLGIDFGAREGATHLVVVTDGLPDSEALALDAARRFGGPIDVFYIGDGDDRGAYFAQMLASETGGSVNLTDLGQPKQLARHIAGFLGEAPAA
jgi:hypothetical protein